MSEDGVSDTRNQGAAPAAPAEQAKTTDVPLALFPGGPPKPGDVCGFKVVAVNADAGTVTVAYADKGDEEMGGADGMASEFSKEKMNGAGTAPARPTSY